MSTAATACRKQTNRQTESVRVYDVRNLKFPNEASSCMRKSFYCFWSLCVGSREVSITGFCSQRNCCAKKERRRNRKDLVRLICKTFGFLKNCPIMLHILIKIKAFCRSIYKSKIKYFVMKFLLQLSKLSFNNP